MNVAVTSGGAFTRWTGVALVLAAATAILGTAIRGDIGRLFDSVSLLLLGTLPSLRVVVLAVRWARNGDRRYASAAVALVFLMGIGVVVVAVWR